MCGIFCYFCRKSAQKDKRDIITAALETQHRGPDETHIIHGECRTGLIDRYHLIFHRLMVNGLSPESGQPLVYPAGSESGPTCYLLCNGEIYNYKDLIIEYGLEGVYDSSSDCEIILHLYQLVRRGKMTESEMLMKLRGVFAFVILDTDRQQIFMARDPLGVRSMYYCVDDDGYGFCSELKSLYPLADAASISQFPGGCYGYINYGLGSDSDSGSVSGKLQIHRYYNIWAHGVQEELVRTEDEVAGDLVKLLTQATERRIMCDRKTADGQPAVGAYLSGGFDSSAIAGLLASIYPGKLHTFSIGFKDAPDLLAARKVAEYIGSEHHEVIVTEEEMLGLLKRVPVAIESYDTTTNRASAFMLRLSEYIRDNTDIIVVYSGEGSDELFGSYLYFHNAPCSSDFHNETVRLLHDLQYFDLLRGDKSSAAAGLEIRVPFLDIDFVNYSLQVPPSLKMKNGIEKYILRKALSLTGLIPDEICWRTKEAMSDGVSLGTRSWSGIIQEMALREAQSHHKYISGPDDPDRPARGDSVKLEKQWFKRQFSSAYPGCEETIPYEWLPKWCGDIQDPSARVLGVYKEKIDGTGEINEVV